MTQIVSVNTLEDRVLDIVLNNGSKILLDLEPLFSREPPYTWLKRGTILPRPETDGKNVRWPDGTCFSLQDIFSILGAAPGSRKATNQTIPILQIVGLEAMDFETLSVDFNNGSVVILNLRQLLSGNPTNFALRHWPTLSHPETDGVNIRWEDGPTISLIELFKMIGAHDLKEDMK